MGHRWIVAVGVLCCALFGMTGAASATVTPTNVSAKPCSGTYQAGSHRDFCIAFDLANGGSSDDAKDLVLDLPAGVVGDPTAATTCARADFLASSHSCPAGSRVGDVSSIIDTGIPLVGEGLTASGEIYNLAPTATEPARLGILLNQGAGALSPVALEAPVRVRVADAGLRSITAGIPRRITLPLVGESDITITHMALTLWGPKAGTGRDMGKPFITLPTRCDVPATTTLSVTSYENATASATGSFIPSGCGNLPFTPQLQVGPATSPADTPGEASATLMIDDTPNSDSAIRQAYLKDVDLKLPVGLQLNPPLANGLEPCTPEQFGFGIDAPPGCPASSEMGRVEFVTPLFPGATLTGKVYFGTPRPGVPLVNFISVEDARLRLKLGGFATIDPDTTAVTAHFTDQPQVPFTSFKFIYTDPGDGRATLTSPTACGDYSVTADMTPWGGGAVASPNNTFKVIDCQPPTFAPGLSASLPDTQAGGDAALTVNILRPDKNLRLLDAKVSLPPGLTGKLPAVPACEVADARANACTDASLVGSAKVAVGTGPMPLSLPGKVYLTKGFDGGIAGLAVSVNTNVPAMDLGTVVVMNKLVLRPDTGIDVVTEDLPQSLQGIPTAYRSIDLTIDRKGFMQNATSCAANPLHGTFTAVGGTTATADAPYQATGCDKLAFSPKLTASVGSAGEVAKGKHPPLKVTIEQPAGQAAMSRTVVSLPDGIGVDLKNLKSVCADAQLQSGTCPAASKIGGVTAETPLLPTRLSGGVYLTQGATKGGLPGIALDLGLLRLKGTVALGKRLVTTFEGIPDVPLRRLVLDLSGGPRAVLATSKGLCDQDPTVQATYGAHSGAKGNQTVKATVIGCAPLSGTGELYGVAKQRPTLRLTLAATAPLRELRLKLPSTLKIASSAAVKKSGRLVMANKKLKGATVRWSKGRIAFKAPKGKTARAIQLTLPRGVLRLKRKVKSGSSQTLTVTGIRSDGKTVSAKIKVKAAR
ncbi:hypothetical protein [Baekduia sp.]|uniref:hypothetical protein n=1 Tax=Baekduia sp. TaxID=2600305 RepID=UPI002D1FA894|nr:hypothetical protein [Baekduia sp.]